MSRRSHRTVFKSFQLFLHANVVHSSRLSRTGPKYRPLSTGAAPISTKRSSAKPWILYPATALLLGGAGYVAYENYQPFRHTLLAVVRCSRIARMCTISFWYTADRRHEVRCAANLLAEYSFIQVPQLQEPSTTSTRLCAVTYPRRKGSTRIRSVIRVVQRGY